MTTTASTTPIMPLFTITAKKSILDDLTLYEKVDKVILNKLINSTLLKKTFHNKYAERVYHNEKEQLMAYASKMKYGKVKVTYNKNKNNQYGRSNPDKALGLFCIRREIRHTLCGDTMADIDVDNCHPVILNQLCENENINHYELNKYVKNRDDYFTAGMNAYGCSRDDIKVLFIIYCYGGGIKKWIHNREIDITKCSPEAVNNGTIIEIPIMKQFHDSMESIHVAIGKKNQDLCNIVIKNKKDANITEFNLWGTVCSFVLQEYECRMLEAMYKYLVKSKIIVDDLCVLCADGLMINKKKFTPELLHTLKAVIKTEVGFDVNLSQKEMNSGYLDILDDNIIKPEEDIKVKDKNEADKLFIEMSTEFEKLHTKIINGSIYIKKVDDKAVFMSRKDMITSYEHRQCGVNEHGKPISFIDKWIVNNTSINVKESMDVYPDIDRCPDNVYNLWTPFEIEKYDTTYTDKTDDLAVILNHILILCGNDKKTYDYFISWIAKMIQQPYNKLSCIVLISKQGAGKGTLMRLFANMIGKHKVYESTNPSRDVWGNFNDLMTDAFLVNINELEYADAKKGENQFKALISDGTITINPKGQKPIKVKSYHRFIVTTNKENPMPIESADRRFVVIKSSDEKCKDFEYFTNIHDIIEDIDTVRTAYDYFKNYDISEYDHNVYPRTEYLEDLMLLNTTAPELWLKDFTIENMDNDTKELLGGEIFNLFTLWCNTNNYTYITNPIKLALKIKNLNIDGVVKGRPTKKGKTTIFNIKEMIKYFELGCLVEL